MPSRAEFHIIVTETGQIEVSGPIHDKMTCYALLEVARDVIKDTNDKVAAQSKIVPAAAADLGRFSS